jgi:hypothetical protein
MIKLEAACQNRQTTWDEEFKAHCDPVARLIAEKAIASLFEDKQLAGIKSIDVTLSLTRAMRELGDSCLQYPPFGEWCQLKGKSLAPQRHRYLKNHMETMGHKVATYFNQFYREKGGGLCPGWTFEVSCKKQYVVIHICPNGRVASLKGPSTDSEEELTHPTLREKGVVKVEPKKGPLVYCRQAYHDMYDEDWCSPVALSIIAVVFFTIFMGNQTKIELL